MKYQGLYIAQQPVEFRAWKERVAAIRPKTYLEIGSLNGGTLLMVAGALTPGATIISLDVFASPPLRDSLEKLRGMGFDVHFILGDSTSPRMPGKIADILGGRWLDAAFIDGDHSFACALSDYRLLLKMTRKGGLLGFHDLATKPDNPMAVCQSVGEVWDYIKSQHPGCTEEYVVRLPKVRPKAGSVGNGIGVLEVRGGFIK